MLWDGFMVSCFEADKQWETVLVCLQVLVLWSAYSRSSAPWKINALTNRKNPCNELCNISLPLSLLSQLLKFLICSLSILTVDQWTATTCFFLNLLLIDQFFRTGTLLLNVIYLIDFPTWILARLMLSAPSWRGLSKDEIQYTGHSTVSPGGLLLQQCVEELVMLKELKLCFVCYTGGFVFF